VSNCDTNSRLYSKSLALIFTPQLRGTHCRSASAPRSWKSALLSPLVLMLSASPLLSLSADSPAAGDRSPHTRSKLLFLFWICSSWRCAPSSHNYSTCYLCIVLLPAGTVPVVSSCVRSRSSRSDITIISCVAPRHAQSDLLKCPSSFLLKSWIRVWFRVTSSGMPSIT